MARQTTPIPESLARPMNSEQVTAGVNGEAVKLPERKPMKFYRFEMYGRTALGDLPLKDDDGKPIVYTDLEIATAHLEALPSFDAQSSIPTVFFFRAVYEVNDDGTSKHWLNANKTETVEIFTKELDAKGHVREVPRLVTRVLSEDDEAMQKFRELRKNRAAATTTLRRQLYNDMAKISAAS